MSAMDERPFLLGSSNNSSRVLHIRDPDAPEDSLCRHTGSWNPKRQSHTQWFDVCDECRRKEAGR